MKLRRLLIVDDEESIGVTLKEALSDEGYYVWAVQNGYDALHTLEKCEIQVVFLDIWMQPLDGLEVLKKIKEKFPHVAVIMMSGHGSIETAVTATKLGAFDYVEKPLSLERILVLLNNLNQILELEEENERLRQEVDEKYALIGESQVVKQIKKLIQVVAPTNSWILITGENGTGKELVARELHHLSQRKDRAFVAVNCAAIPEGLIETELFGHEKGAFTGAYARKKGKFDMADGGTLFLDEIGDMSLHTQAKLLRILQEQQFERVGGNETIQIDVRVIAATNKDLSEEIKNNRFREDLYYRLNVIPFHISPLRERKEDILSLSEYFLADIAKHNKAKKKSLAPRALKKLEEYHWPGNIRELRNLIERFAVMTESTEIGERDVILSHGAGNKEVEISACDLKGARGEFEKQFIMEKLSECEGNVSKTAKAIGLERSHLHRKIKQHNIKL